jgi:uncharacterized protein with von Willebrand factor type A (vWA) domain
MIPALIAHAPAQHGSLIERYPALQGQFKRLIQDEERQNKQNLHRENPFLPFEERLLAAERAAALEDPSLDQLAQDIRSYSELLNHARAGSDQTYWEHERQRVEGMGERSRRKELNKLRTLLLRNWRKKLDQAHAAWELEQIRLLREALLERLLQWLARLEVIERVARPLGLDLGRLIDFGSGALSPQDLEQLTRWAEYLDNDQDVRALCALLGRATQQERSSKLERIQTQSSVDVVLPDIHSREELVGIEFRKNVSHAIPGEWMLLGDPESEVLFDLKVAESRLLCFAMEGQQLLSQQQSHIQTRVVEEDSAGPVILCVDTSGSMNGTPEHIAKAMALTFALRTQQEGRACYLINFSTHIDVLDLSAGFGLPTLMKFLRMSFHGGTDAAPAIQHALHLLRSESYRRADILVISDFVMAELPRDTLQAIAAHRSDGTRFSSLCIGSGFPSTRVREFFDREWMFDPCGSSLVELSRLRDQILDPRPRNH